jgi:uncharacterized protein YfiM (DUF2279 family)
LKKASIIFLILLTCHVSSGQTLFERDTVFNKKRTLAASIFNAAAWSGSIATLQFVWYDDFSKSSFHTFNDNFEWQQMDKVGHMVTSWHFARAGGDLYEWSGVNHKTASIIGASYSIGYMTTFELLDGYSADWGFSWGDIGFNSLGSFTYFIQEFLWNEQYATFKFSAHHSGLANYRPDVLGNDFASRTLKDYNGQTYWMSFNPIHWFKHDAKFPKWINLSLGYGIEDQIYGDGSVYVLNNGSSQINFNPYRQYYLSLDIDFEKIPTTKKWLKFIFRSINIFKIPFPALEISRGEFLLKPFYF